MTNTLVAIKGMDMPDDCAYCIIRERELGYCQYLNKQVEGYEDKRDASCPLVELEIEAISGNTFHWRQEVDHD